MRRLRGFLFSKFFLIPVVSLLLYTFVGFFVAPFAVRWYVPKYAREQLHFQASLEKVRIHPFAMSFEAGGFNLVELEGTRVAGFERLFIDFEITSLFRWTVMFREFQLEKPALNVVIEPSGSINLTRLIPKSTEQKASTESKSIGLILQTVAITDGEVTITDKRQSSPVVLTFQDLDVDLHALSTLRDRNGTYALAARTADGETVQWRGEIGLAPFRSSGRIVFSSIQTATLWKLVQHGVSLQSPSGSLDLSTDYRLDLNETPLQLSLQNLRVDLSTLSLELPGTDKSFLELKKLEIDCALFDFAARNLQVKNLLVNGGLLQVLIDEAGQSNLQRVVHRNPEQKAGEQTQDAHNTSVRHSSDDSSPWTVDVEAIEVNDFAFGLEDRSRTSPLIAGISSVSLRSEAKIETGPKTSAWVRQLTAELKGVRLGNKEVPTPLFEAQRLTLEGGEIDLGARAIVISRIGLSDGHIDIAREKDGTMNLEHLIASRSEDSKGPEAMSPHPVQTSAWKFLLKSFELTGFRSALSDYALLPEKPLYNVQDLNAKVTEVDGKSPMGFEVSFGVEQGGKVALRGKVDPGNHAVEANFKVAGLVLTPLEPYLAPFITLTLQSAAVSSEGNLRYSIPGTGSKLTYEGSFALDKFSLNQPGSAETLFGWGSMQIPQLELALEPNRLEIGEIRLSKPVGRLIISEDRTVNLAKILKEQPAATGSPALSKAPAKAQSKRTVKKTSAVPKASPGRTDTSFPFSIGRVRIDDGNMVFADFSLSPKFMTRMHGLKGTVSRLSSNKNLISEIQLDGRVDEYGMARIRGSMDIGDFSRSTDINMVFRNVEMASVTPYSGKFAGRKIKSGKLSMDLKYRIQDTKLVGDNAVIVENLVLGEHVDSPDAVNLPLDLAIALLSDSNGRIDIGLPVSGDLNDPQFSIGPLVWKAFVTIITKAVTAPFRALGALFGGESDELDGVQFDPGQAELLPPEREKLKKVAEVLNKRPQLRLLVQGRYSPEADGMDFKQLSVRRAVYERMGLKAGSNEDPGALDFSDSKTGRALEKIFEERFGELALDELDQAVKRGEIKPRETQKESSEKKKARKTGRVARVLNAVKFYKIIPGAKSPEESELMAGELYARLVESEPVSQEALQQLAGNRARAIGAELQNTCGVAPERFHTVDSESLAEEEGLSAKLSLDAMSAAR